jgi:hypothetical protein
MDSSRLALNFALEGYTDGVSECDGVDEGVRTKTSTEIGLMGALVVVAFGIAVSARVGRLVDFLV